jgi:hypothetical protein
MHQWGDEDFDWNGLNDAIFYMHKRMKTYARIGVHSKEKYGRAVLNCYFVDTPHSLIWPGYVYNQYPYKWMWNLDVDYGYKLLYYTGIWYIVSKWQKFIFVDTYRRAVKKWPHLKDEILCDAHPMEWLEEAGICKVSDYWQTFEEGAVKDET